MPNNVDQRRRFALRPAALLAASTVVAISGFTLLGSAVAAPSAPTAGQSQNDVKDGKDDVKDGKDDGKDDVKDGKDDVKDGKDDVKDGKDDVKEPEDQVTLCHATSSRTNPYEEITIDRSGVLGSEQGKKDGHDSHHSPEDVLYPADNWGDIIPPFGTYQGKNWPEGKAILDAGCKVTPPTPLTPSIAISKVTSADGITPGDGISVTAGTAITWTYSIKNGPVAVTGLTLVDDREGAISCRKTALEPLEDMDCFETGIAGATNYSNVGTVTATPATGGTVSDTDASSYQVTMTTVIPQPPAIVTPGGGTPNVEPSTAAVNVPPAAISEPVVVAPQAATVPETVVVTPQLATVPEEAVQVAVTPQQATIPMAAQAGGGSSSNAPSTAMALLLLIVGSLGALGAGLRLMANRIQ